MGSGVFSHITMQNIYGCRKFWQFEPNFLITFRILWEQNKSRSYKLNETKYPPPQKKTLKHWWCTRTLVYKIEVKNT